MSDDSDALLRRLAQGDEQAFSRLYDLNSPLMFAVACRMLGSSEAEDALQETFLQVWNKAADFDPMRGSARAWLVLLTRSRCLDRLRRIGTRRKTEGPAHADEDGVAQEPADDRPMASEEFERAEENAAVRAAIQSLPEPQRRALELAYFEGMSQTQIAAATGEPLGTVKTRMRLAMLKLIEIFKPRRLS